MAIDDLMMSGKSQDMSLKLIQISPLTHNL